MIFIGFEIPEYIVEILKIVLIIFGAVIADIALSKYLKSLASILHVRVETIKGIRFFFRFIIIAVMLILLASVKWFPSEYFVGAGAIIGTVIGFASANAISNFLSGASVLISRVIRIGDYVRIDDIEGIVVDMSVSYTKIQLDDGSFVYISNKDISAKKIMNYRVEKNDETYFIYPIEFTLERAIGVDEVRKTVQNIYEELKDKIDEIELRIDKFSRLEVRYVLSIRVKKAEDIIHLKPKILGEIAKEFRG